MDNLQNKTLPQDSEREMERIAESKPVVGIVEVTHPIEVSLALRVIPPDIARVTVAIEGYVRDTINITTL